MSQKQTYTFYFEIFGQKKQWSTDADNALEARTALDKFLCAQVSVHKTSAVPAAEKTGFNKFQELIDEAFGKTFSDIFK